MIKISNNGNIGINTSSPKLWHNPKLRQYSDYAVNKISLIRHLFYTFLINGLFGVILGLALVYSE